MTSNSPRILIVDQSLRDMAGHHYEYDLALFRAAADAGVRVVVGAHASVQPLDLLGDNVRAWFQRAWYESHEVPPAPVAAAKPVLGWLPSSIRAPLARSARRVIGPRQAPPVRTATGSGFGDEVLALIRAEGLGANDHVLIHTFSIPELDSLIELARSHDELPPIHIIFRRDAEEPSVAGGPDGGIRGSLTRLASFSSAVAVLRLYADTEDLARQYAALVPGLKTAVIPIPHCLPPSEATDVARKEGPLRIVYLGDARDEKGFHLLPDLVDALADQFFSEARARFVVQGNISVAGDNPMLSAARERLAAYPPGQVELMAEQLGVAAFHDLVRNADIVLLPYDPKAYARRSSGILIQALAAGRVVVVPAQTWLAAQVHPAASVLFGSDGTLADAVATAVDDWPRLSKGAQERAELFRAHHDPSRYITQLLRART
jgi:hypothetical protein